jgi:hypothetical protein
MTPLARTLGLAGARAGSGVGLTRASGRYVSGISQSELITLPTERQRARFAICRQAKHD